MSVSRFVAALLVGGLAISPLHAQSSGLRDLIPELFQFGDCGEPLCLNSNVNAATGHGSHYIGSTVQGFGKRRDGMPEGSKRSARRAGPTFHRVTNA